MRYLVVVLVVLCGCATGHQTARVQADMTETMHPRVAAYWQYEVK